MPQYERAKNILLYFPIRNEADITRLLEDSLRTGKHVFLPVMQDANHFEAREYEEFGLMVKNSLNILEPIDGETIAPEKLELIVIPGLAFDKSFNRVGFGAGCYDRYLDSAVNAYKIGAAYAFQILDRIEQESHDFCLDAIATERDIFYRV
jgi:5-formyltetrahydrofolate cyclo-ligase